MQLQLKAQTGREVGSPCWCLRWLRSLQSVACTDTGTLLAVTGSVPRDWLLGAITAIHKKGDATDPNNYRGITVGHVLGKLYALMLNLRLSAWAEANKIRGDSGGKALSS